MKESTGARRVAAVMSAIAMSCAGYSHLSAGAPAYFKEARHLKLHGPTYSVAWSPNGKRLAVLEPPYLDIFDTDTWASVAKLQVLNRLYTARSLQYLSDSKILIGGGGINAVNGPHNEFALTIANDSELDDIQFLPDQSNRDYGPFYPQDNFILSQTKGQLASTDVTGRSLYVYEMSSLHLSGVIQAPQLTSMQTDIIDANVLDRFSSFSFSPIGSEIASCSVHGALYIIDTRMYSIINSRQIFQEGERCDSVSYIPNGEYLMFVGQQSSLLGNAGTIKLYNISTSRLNNVDGNFGGAIHDLVWTEDGTLVVAGAKHISFGLLDTGANRFFVSQRVDAVAFKLAASASGRVAAVQGTDVVVYSRQEGMR